MILLGGGAFFLLSDDSVEDAELKARAKKVTLDFIHAYYAKDFDTACRLVVPHARDNGKFLAPECEDAWERKKSEAEKATVGDLEYVDKHMTVKSVKLVSNSKAHATMAIDGTSMVVFILRRSGDSWLIEGDS
ncbi:hypothetical protein B7755_012955 [Streptomyces sp. NBS 14/10]|uniref:hypothetical protein n=1 Tax=Streptomyces sp. NBS 14/10 TaxID=1945643 RepID=UPI00117E71DA|nr:hypothetical protein [Streptomyces sp. NBS 14/10]KAK1178974.1 hypothetical protein B7755_012955 [Streptomyces sp. NBS 14/10]